MMKQEEYIDNNDNLPNSEGSLKIKLLTDELLEDIRLYLNGGYEKIIYNHQTGEQHVEKITIGTPKCNEKGMQSLMFFLKTHFNQHIVLGNISDKQYTNILYRTRLELAKNLMIQRINYGISLADYSEIMDYLMQSFEIYLTRAISGGERNSITKSHQTVERSLTEQPKRNFLGL